MQTFHAWAEALASIFTYANLIPASVVAAIGLFACREWLESKRKKAAKITEINALKKILARECQLNWYLRIQVKDLCTKFEPFEKMSSDKCPYKLRLSDTPSGKTRFEIIEGGQVSSAGLLTKPCLTNFSKYLYDIAKIDLSFYELLVPAYAAAIELKHFYDSLIDLESTGELMTNDNMMLGFSGYALKELEWIDNELKTLYLYCTGEELTRGLLR